MVLYDANTSGGASETGEPQSPEGSLALLARLSLRGHFLCWGHQKGANVSAKVASYACLVAKLPSTYRWSSVDRFLEAVDPSGTSPGHAPIGLQRQEFTTYIVHLAALVLLEKAGSGNDPGSGDEISDSTMLLGRVSKDGLVALPVRGTRMLLQLLGVNPEVESLLAQEIDAIRQAQAARAQIKGPRGPIT